MDIEQLQKLLNMSSNIKWRIEYPAACVDLSGSVSEDIRQ